MSPTVGAGKVQRCAKLASRSRGETSSLISDDAMIFQNRKSAAVLIFLDRFMCLKSSAGSAYEEGKGHKV